MTIEKHYSIKQLARLLNISERTLWSWVKSKKLRSVKIGAIVRVSSAAVKDLGFDIKESEDDQNGD